MSNVDLKFSPEMTEKVLAGEKCCTSRRDLKGVPGDFFELEGARFRILDVSREWANLIARALEAPGLDGQARSMNHTIARVREPFIHGGSAW